MEIIIKEEKKYHDFSDYPVAIDGTSVLFVESNGTCIIEIDQFNNITTYIIDDFMYTWEEFVKNWYNNESLEEIKHYKFFKNIPKITIDFSKIN